MTVLSSSPPATGGLLDAVRAIGATLGEMVRVRGALLAVELREEMLRRKHMLVLAALGLAALHMALLMLTLLVIVVFWDTHRIAAIGTLTALYLAGGAAVLIRLQAEVAASPDPFAETRREFDRDLAQLREPR